MSWIIGNLIFLTFTDMIFYLTPELDMVQDGDHKRELPVINDHTVQNDSNSDEGTIQINMEQAANDHAVQPPVIHKFFRLFGDIRSVSLSSVTSKK